MDIEDLFKSSIPREPVSIKLMPDEIRTIYRSFIQAQDTAEMFVTGHEGEGLEPGRELWIERLESLRNLIDRWEREFSNYSLDTVGDD